MPPRTRREAPHRRDARIQEHLQKAAEYRSKWPEYLAQGDLCQAGEKGWGTVAQLTKAVATLRGWEHYDHVAIREAVKAIANELTESSPLVRRGLYAAESLHGNFYEAHMDRDDAEFGLGEIIPLLDILWERIPAQYTGGVSFAEWVAQGPPNPAGE